MEFTSEHNRNLAMSFLAMHSHHAQRLSMVSKLLLHQQLPSHFLKTITIFLTLHTPPTHDRSPIIDYFVPENWFLCALAFQLQLEMQQRISILILQYHMR